MSIADDKAKSRAYWEWLRTANPLLPPFHMVKDAEMDDRGELTMTVRIVLPEEPFRFGPWEEALAQEGCTELTWDGHLAAALRWLSSALEGRESREGGFPYQIYLLRAAAHIRAMAPEETKWDEPSLLVPGGERPRLRSVVQSLLEADKGHSACFRNEGSVTYHLVSAEASLHGLWLAAKEG